MVFLLKYQVRGVVNGNGVIISEVNLVNCKFIVRQEMDLLATSSLLENTEGSEKRV